MSLMTWYRVSVKKQTIKKNFIKVLMIQRLIIPLGDCHAFSLSSPCFLPAHIPAAHKLLFHEIKK